MLDQRQRRWADVVQIIYKCFVFAGVAVRDEGDPLIKTLLTHSSVDPMLNQH